MADMNRRKGGATAARSHQAYMQNTAQSPQFQAYQQQQQQQMQAYQQQLQLQQQQQQQQMQFKHQQHQQHQQARMSNGAPAAVNRYPRDRAGPVRGQQQKAPVSAKMGIKSGMTVEDLKRLTQKRMQQNSAAAAATSSPRTPRTPVAAAIVHEASSRPSTPTATPMPMPMPPSTAGPTIPKTGMTVQELKQLTTLRLAASQTAPSMRPSDAAGFANNAAVNLTNVAKSHYRDSLRGTSSLTPTSTPKRGPSAAATPMMSALSLTPDVRGHRSRSRSSQFAKTVEAPTEATQLRYSYSGGQTIDDYLSFDNNSTSSQETDSYVQPSLDLDDDSRYPTDEPTHHSLQFPDDSFPPPPPMDENGGFMGNALPSWSPPPNKAKKYESGGSRFGSDPQMSFYNQQTSYYNIASKEETAAVDQNAVIAPPPGLSRRPSMTVPWQVAEAVLNTPQTASSRKQLQSPAASTTESENATLFAKATASANRAADVAAQLSAMSLQIGRNPRSNTTASVASSGGASANGAVTAGSSPPSTGSQPLSNGPRRGSFGNAAEFFKFRRRSKSRLELARDLSGNFVSDNEVVPGFSNYSIGSGIMPGIDERRADLMDALPRSPPAPTDTVSDASSSSSSSASDNGSSSQGYDDDEIVQITGGYDDPSEIAGNFVSFYHATGASRSRDGLSGLSSLSIPPPPPPPLTDDDASSTTSSAKGGLPVMSPNGFRLRKVAELARRGSLSSEDKTRAKDEIIQSSLGIGASNAARLLAPKVGSGNGGVAVTVSSVAAPPPPGFAVLSATPPRTTPRASAKKTLAPGAGIVRSSAGGAVAPAAATGSAGSATLEERLASAAQRVADCVSKGDMVGFQQAMDELDWLRNEASSMMRG